MQQFHLAQAVKVPNLEGIHECFEVIERTRPSNGEPYFSFAVNVSIEKLRPLLISVINQLDEPCFFLCEMPCNRQQEEKLRKSEQDPLHCNVYYKDGCSRKELLDILDEYGEWFIQDGLSRFGFASHRTKDEIFVSKYKVTYLYTGDMQRYKDLLHRFAILQEENIKTVWKNFSREAPGECALFTHKGKSVHEIIAALLCDGMYLAEQREE